MNKKCLHAVTYTTTTTITPQPQERNIIGTEPSSRL